MGSSSPPQPEDPNQVATSQQSLNTTSGTASQAGSNVNQVNPYGSLTYAQTGVGPGGVPTYTATEQLSPAQQQLLQSLQGTQQTAQDQAGTLLANAGYGSKNPSDVIGSMTSGNTQAILGQETAYLDPQFNQQTTQLDTQLRNQGFDPSSPAYKQAMNNLYQSQNQQVSGFLAQAEPQAYSQATQSYELPLSLATSELGISQPGSVNTNLTTTPGLNVQPANLEGAVAQSENIQEQNYAQSVAQQNAELSAAGQLLGTLGTAGIKYAADGGDISGPTVVGERGPEIFIPRAPGTVISHENMIASLFGGGR